MGPDNDYYYRSPRRNRLFPGLFFAVLLGVIIGAALLYALFYYDVLPPEQFSDPFVPDDELPAPAETQPPHQQDLATIEVVKRVMPAVVGVSRYVYAGGIGQRSLVEDGSGSGVVLTADGYIITNQHVIAGADQIRVVFPGSRYYDAELVGEDVLTDLALLKIEESGLPTVPLGNSAAINVGESVLAFGNPLGFFQQTVTSGIISAVGRQVNIPDSEYSYTFIQTDAVINPGNSGGPLVNMRGEVIGINSAKVSRLGVEGIGLSIPGNTVRRVAGDLKTYGRVLRPQLGVRVGDLRYFTAEPTDRGVYITEVFPGSPAEQGGLQPEDVITAIDEKEVHYLAQLFDVLLNYYPGDEISVSILRDGKEYIFQVRLNEMPRQ
jgi:serine protease Do